MRSLFGRMWWHVWRKHHAQRVRLATHTDETYEGVWAYRGGGDHVLASAQIYTAQNTLEALGGRPWTKIPSANVLHVVYL